MGNASVPPQHPYAKPNLSKRSQKSSDESLYCSKRPPTPTAREEIFVREGPLSASQLAIWRSEQAFGKTSAYHIPIAWRIDGELREDRLRLALEQFVKRHETLRSRYLDLGIGPLQCVLDHDPLRLRRIDLVNHADKEAAVAALLADEAATPFALAHESPMRAAIAVLGPSAHVLCLTFHHLASDGWSNQIVTRELAAAYRGEPFESMPPGYLGLMDRQVIHANAAARAAALDHWRKVLAPRPPAMRLPHDRRPLAHVDLEGGVVAFDLDRAHAVRLQALAARSGCPPFAVAAAALALLLRRHTSETDLCLAYPVANRDKADVRDTVGCFVDTLPLRLRIDVQDSLIGLLRQVRDAMNASRPHRGVPFDEVVAELAAAGEAPFEMSPVLLNLHRHARPSLDLVDLRCDPLPRAAIDTPFALAWVLSMDEHAVSGRLEFQRALFDDGSAKRLVDHFVAILRKMGESPECSLAEIGPPPAGQLALLRAWSGIDAAPQRAVSWLESFARHVAVRPEATAVEVDGIRIDYATLDARARATADALRRSGAAAERPVAVCVGRGIGLVTSLLAVAMAGGVFLPLDTAQPTSRLRDILAASGASVLLMRRGTTPTLDAAKGVAVVFLEDDICNTSASPALLDPHPRQAAYCVYTSGSTGKPKGVTIEVSALAAHAQACVERYGLTPKDRVLQFATAGFDTAIEQIVATLAAGASIVARGDVDWSTAELVDAIDTLGITVADIPTSFWHTEPVLRQRRSASQLRLTIIGGEPALSALATGDVFSPTLNAYGPTEATITACIGDIRDAQPERSNFAPIGRPLPGMRVHVLDEQLQQVPIGTWGELHLGGDRLARGYAGDPAATAMAFVPDFIANDGGRLYRTGDICRFRADGTLEISGRRDDQVKIRGFRVELGEIEATLREGPGVAAAMVIARLDAADETVLVAHLVLNSGYGLDAVRSFARSRLPRAMIPAHWETHLALPLAPTGKVDRRGLADRPLPVATVAGPVAPPGDDITYALVREAATIAPAIAPGADDDLLDAGFHSLLLVKLATACRERYGSTLRMRDLLRARTLRGVAAMLQHVSDNPGTLSQ